MKHHANGAGDEGDREPPEGIRSVEAEVDLKRASECDGAEREADDRQVESAKMFQ